MGVSGGGGGVLKGCQKIRKRKGKEERERERKEKKRKRKDGTKKRKVGADGAPSPVGAPPPFFQR